MAVYAGEDVEKEENSSIAGGSANLYNHFGNQYGCFLGKWKSVYLKIQQFLSWAHSNNKDICSTIFIAALFVISRTWKQPRCPTTEEWIEKTWYIYTIEYYSEEKTMES
ncbi:Retrovirus-related Pol polyprotein LINE-1 [Cricetulus griseus]|uniref:Retrovirus-related Pol polyprotein LINE-1 n=1 Tax=Cricetulus griseus TaxID=10029 RepID=G3GSA5_CRIGR|nr:Retrovirus-related Pol polyprotein LINE-1 [Cricetulus griseus]